MTVSLPGDAPGSTVPPVLTSERTVPDPRSVPPWSRTAFPSVAPAATVVRPAVCVSVPTAPASSVPKIPPPTVIVPAFSSDPEPANVPAAVLVIVPATRLRSTPGPVRLVVATALEIVSAPAFSHVDPVSIATPPDVRSVAPLVRSSAPPATCVVSVAISSGPLKTVEPGR